MWRIVQIKLIGDPLEPQFVVRVGIDCFVDLAKFNFELFLQLVRSELNYKPAQTHA